MTTYRRRSTPTRCVRCHQRTNQESVGSADATLLLRLRDRGVEHLLRFVFAGLEFPNVLVENVGGGRGEIHVLDVGDARLQGHDPGQRSTAAKDQGAAAVPGTYRSGSADEGF